MVRALDKSVSAVKRRTGKNRWSGCFHKSVSAVKRRTGKNRWLGQTHTDSVSYLCAVCCVLLPAAVVTINCTALAPHNCVSCACCFLQLYNKVHHPSSSQLCVLCMLLSAAVKSGAPPKLLTTVCRVRFVCSGSGGGVHHTRSVDSGGGNGHHSAKASDRCAIVTHSERAIVIGAH